MAVPSVAGERVAAVVPDGASDAIELAVAPLPVAGVAEADASMACAGTPEPADGMPTRSAAAPLAEAPPFPEPAPGAADATESTSPDNGCAAGTFAACAAVALNVTGTARAVATPCTAASVDRTGNDCASVSPISGEGRASKSSRSDRGVPASSATGMNVPTSITELASTSASCPSSSPTDSVDVTDAASASIAISNASGASSLTRGMTASVPLVASSGASLAESGVARVVNIPAA